MADAQSSSNLPRKLALAFAATLLALVGVELAVRLLALAPPVKGIDLEDPRSVYQRSSNPVLGFELKAGYRNPDADLRQSYPSTNAHGQRDKEREIQKPAGVRRLVLLGDSIVEGYGIAQIDELISQRLEQTYPPETVEVLNFGVSGYCTLAEVELLETRALRFEPDQVVLVFVENDFDNFNREAFRLGSGRDRPALARAAFRRSHAFRVLATSFDLYGYGLESDPVRWNKRAIGDDNVTQGLERFAELSRRHGFDAVVVVWPVFRDENVVDVREMPDDASELIVEYLARTNGIPVFRLSHRFREVMASMAEPVNPRLEWTVGDGLHPNAEGNRLAAEAIRRVLDDLPERRGREPDPEETRRTERYAVARGAAADAGGSEPDYSRVHNNVGVDLVAQGRLDEAIAEFRKAIRADPLSAEGHGNLGNALRAQGRTDVAIRHYEEAVRLAPDNAEARFNLGLALTGTGRNEEAIEHLTRSLEIRPGQTQAERGLARALVSAGRAGEAMEAYRRALEREPDNGELHRELADLLRAGGDGFGAVRHYRRVAQLEPANARAQANLGAALASLGQFDEAARALREAVRLDPDYAMAHRNLARVLTVLGRPDEARPYRERAAELETR